MTGASARAAEAEVEASIRRAFFYAGFADKFDGAVHATRSRFVTLAMNEPWGVMGVVCPDEAPLARLRLARHAGDRDGQLRRRRSVGQPSVERDRLLFDPRYVGRSGRRRQHRHRRSERARARRSPSTTASTRSGTSATRPARPQVEALSAGNLKATWVSASAVDWPRAEGREFLRRATQVKNIWTPYGE